MKILSGSHPEPVLSPSQSVVIPPPDNHYEELKSYMEEFVQHAMGEIRLLKDRFSQGQSQGIGKLAQEMEALKDVLSEMRSAPPVTQTLNAVNQRLDALTAELSALRKIIEKPIETPRSEPPESKGPRDHFLDQISFSQPPKSDERKVAFLTKLWDYLNEVAIEIPLRKHE